MNRVKNSTLALMSFLTICGGAAENSGAIAKPKQGRVDLTGDWRVTSPNFHSATPRERGCHNGARGGQPEIIVAKLKIIQKQDSSVIIPPFDPWAEAGQQGLMAVKNAKVTGTVLSWTGTGAGFTTHYKGTISPDGNKITGREICEHTSGKATASGPFTLVRLLSPKKKPQIPTISGNG